jgi:hypothetical protein
MFFEKTCSFIHESPEVALYQKHRVKPHDKK